MAGRGTEGTQRRKEREDEYKEKNKISLNSRQIGI